MRLAKWREEQGLSQAQLADRLGCDQSYICRIERAVDPQVPRRSWMVRIHNLTRGAVEPNDFYDFPPIGQLELPIEPSGAPLLDLASARCASEPAEDEPQLQAAA